MKFVILILVSLLTFTQTSHALEKTYVLSQPLTKGSSSEGFVKNVLLDKIIKKASEEAGVLYLSTNKMTDDVLTSSISVISSAYVKVKESKISYITVKGVSHLQVTALVYTDDSFIKRQNIILDKALYLTDSIENSLAKIEYQQQKISKLSTSRALNALTKERKNLETYRAALKTTIDSNGFDKNNNKKIRNTFTAKDAGYEYRRISEMDKVFIELLANRWYHRMLETVIKPLEEARSLEIIDVFVHDNQIRSVDRALTGPDGPEDIDNYLYKYLHKSNARKVDVTLAVRLRYNEASNKAQLKDLLSEWFIVEGYNTIKVRMDKAKKESVSIVEWYAMKRLKQRFDDYKWNDHDYDFSINKRYIGTVKASSRNEISSYFDQDHKHYRTTDTSSRSNTYNYMLDYEKNSKIKTYKKDSIWYFDQFLSDRIIDNVRKSVTVSFTKRAITRKNY